MHEVLKWVGASVLMVGLVACGPGQAGEQLDEVGDEATSDSDDVPSESETSSESGDESETSSESASETSSGDESETSSGDESTDSETSTDTGEPICEEFHGTLIVTADTPPESLACVREVDSLIIENTALTDLSIFPALESVHLIVLRDNPWLTSLSGADALEYVWLLFIEEAPMLPSLAGFTPETLGTLSLGPGLDGLVSLDLSADVNVYELRLEGWDRPDASPVADLQPSMTGGYFPVRLTGTAALVDLSAIATCCGGPNLHLLVSEPGQQHFFGLESQTVMGRLELQGSTIESFAGLENLEVLDELVIGELCSVGPNTLTSLAGLSSLTEVQRVELVQNPDLVTLAGLDSLTFINELIVFENQALTDLAFPPGLAVGAEVWIRDNHALPVPVVESFLLSVDAGHEVSCGNGSPNECVWPDGPCPQ